MIDEEKCVICTCSFVASISTGALKREDCPIMQASLRSNIVA